jgi:hypothetical protein
MPVNGFNTPVVMVVFNRPQTTRKVFKKIAELRPTKLLVIADGPRLDRPGENAVCAEVRSIFEGVDWPCEVLKNWADGNLGCQERVVSGLNWVFSLVEEAIILEDDCLPDLSFFHFCEELLAKYRGDTRIAAISGTNFLTKYFESNDSYYFSRFGTNWGWATWRWAWERYDRHLSSWPDNRRNGVMSEIFARPRMAKFWSRLFDRLHDGTGPNTWDFQWLYTGLINNAVTVVPRVNLVTNIGFGSDATHTSEIDRRLVVPSQTMNFPLTHPKALVPMSSIDRRLHDLYSMPLNRRIVRKLMRMVKGPRRPG